MANQTKYAFFPEGPGYLYVKFCGQGFAAVVSLVSSLGPNPTLFVRKTIIPGSENCSNIAPALAEILPSTHEKCSEIRSDSLVLEFCDGGSLDDWFEERLPISVEMANVFAWRAFDDLLGALYHLHSQGISHGDAHSANVFLNWGKSGIPKFMLGDLGCGNDLSLMDQTPDKQQLIRELAVDYDKLTEVLAQIITGIFNPCTSILMHKMDKLLIDPEGFDIELIQLFHHLSRIVDDLYAGNIDLFRKHMEKLKQLVGKYAGLKVSNDTDFSWARPTQPVNRPLLFDSRSELLRATEYVPGPWRIAHIDPTTLEVQAVEQHSFNLHEPRIHEDAPDLVSLMNNRVPTMDMDGRENVVKLAQLIEEGNAIPSNVADNPFAIDTTFDVKSANTNHKRRRRQDDDFGTILPTWKRTKN
ncbi:hypothetical protein H2200_008082 [Cladophialophora chaetospira]|uniref:Protein kinase domain-containing protein n=1 Tax=Cladophialophora chaetospira TaxID=386627 RepID=A0AA38X7H5_9EURO|nr:hypothetical protein H2200_008082 [Cladophialophora chaetospira]